MNFSWLSGGDERRKRDPGDGSSVLLTHHGEVHRLQSLSTKADRCYCFNYPALSSSPPSVKEGRATCLAEGDLVHLACFYALPFGGSDVTVIAQGTSL